MWPDKQLKQAKLIDTVYYTAYHRSKKSRPRQSRCCIDTYSNIAGYRTWVPLSHRQGIPWLSSYYAGDCAVGSNIVLTGICFMVMVRMTVKTRSRERLKHDIGPLPPAHVSLFCYYLLREPSTPILYKFIACGWNSVTPDNLVFCAHNCPSTVGYQKDKIWISLKIIPELVQNWWKTSQSSDMTRSCNCLRQVIISIRGLWPSEKSVLYLEGIVY